jgi:hypothetical protein
MIVSPDVFSEIQWKLLFGYSTFRHEFSFKNAPESLQTIDTISFSIGVMTFTVIGETMNISSRGNFGKGLPSIRTDRRYR